MRYLYAPVYGLIALALFTLGACEKDPDILSESKAHTLLDVAYGSHDKQKMDVYLPADRSTEETKVVVFIHGGAFFAGDRKEVDRAIIDRFVSQGWAVANISYRLVNGHGLGDDLFPPRVDSEIQVVHQVADVSAAVDYILAHSREWAINGHRMGIAGHSAGGSLALLYAYSEYNHSAKVKVVGNLAGAVDLRFTQADVDATPLTKPFIVEFIHRVTGHPFSSANRPYQEAISPHHVVHANKPIPIINVFPQLNFVLGFPRQDRQTYDRFTNRLNTLGIPNHFIQIDGAFHDFNDSQTRRNVVDRTIEFFNEHLQ